MKRDYDLLVFGATGFTGEQAALYLAAHPDRQDFSFAIAGRSQEKLESLAGELEAAGTPADGVVVGDALDASAMDEVAACARVVLSTAGPFAKYGNELVRACVDHGTDYVDITGETPWVRGLIDQHHERARADGVRIIPCCGYDSIPSDLGMLYAADEFHRNTGTCCAQVHAYHRGKGGLNGGTVASMVHMQRGGGAKLMSDPFLLNPSEQRPENEREHRDPVAPFYASEARSWAAPFFMGQINTRVVRRSHALLLQTQAREQPLCREFVYQEYWKASSALGFLEAGALASAQTVGGLMSGLPGVPGVIEAVAAKPGDGPSESTMDNGNFSCDLYARGADSNKDPQQKVVRARLEGEGDPGNRITIKCLCESALLLALQPDALPEEPGGGVLTPASGLGLALVPRLESAGIRFSVD